MAHHGHPLPVTSHSSNPGCLLAHCSFTSLPLPTSSAPPLDQRAALPSDPASRSCHGRLAGSSACIIGRACSPHPFRMPALWFPGVVQCLAPPPPVCSSFQFFCSSLNIFLHFIVRIHGAGRAAPFPASSRLRRAPAINIFKSRLLGFGKS
uniref:Uncharacterized protein n=1 Tax=Triticum urartu TaxID=4572 RepID=A0A8R7QWV9_TRIUA